MATTFEHRREWRGIPLSECSRAQLLEALESEHRNANAFRDQRDKLEARAMHLGVNLWGPTNG